MVSLVKILVKCVQIHEFQIDIRVSGFGSQLPREIEELAMAGDNHISQSREGLELLCDRAPKQFRCFSIFARADRVIGIRAILIPDPTDPIESSCAHSMETTFPVGSSISTIFRFGWEMPTLNTSTQRLRSGVQSCPLELGKHIARLLKKGFSSVSDGQKFRIHSSPHSEPMAPF